MALAATCSRSVNYFRHTLLYRQASLCFSTAVTDLATRTKPKSRKSWRKPRNDTPWSDHQSWEERLSDKVTPLWRMTYEEQLHIKQKNQERIMSQLCGYISEDSSSGGSKLTFPVLPILPSPVTEAYRNKSTFSVNIGPDGNPKTVGFYLGTGRERNIICVNGDHLLNIPEKHKLVARCYQDFIRLSPLEACLSFSQGGHWRDVKVRTNQQGHTMAIVYFHPQSLSPEEVAVHKKDLVDYFIRGPGSVCQLDSLFFQETTMTSCPHEISPYQLLHGQPHMYEEVLGFRFRISADAFFQVNQAAAEVLYTKVTDMCIPHHDEGEGRSKARGTLLDVCCGTGAIGITSSHRVDRIVGVELITQAVEDARHNAAFNDVSNCEFIPGRAEKVLPDLLTQISTAGGGLAATVVNPGRGGLHPRVIKVLRNQPAIRRLVYVSCRPEGEAMRNFRELCCAPNPQKKLTGDPFTPTLAVPVDMFPHTSHCEVVLLFER